MRAPRLCQRIIIATSDRSPTQRAILPHGGSAFRYRKYSRTEAIKITRSQQKSMKKSIIGKAFEVQRIALPPTTPTSGHQPSTIYRLPSGGDCQPLERLAASTILRRPQERWRHAFEQNQKSVADCETY